MPNETDWTQFIPDSLAGTLSTIIAVLIISVSTAIIAYVKSVKFRESLNKNKAFKRFILASKWLIKKWHFISIVSLLLVVDIIIWRIYTNIGIVVLSLFHLLIGALGLEMLVSKPYIQIHKKPKLLQPKFLPILIPPGVGNKYFREFYIDPPVGNVNLGGVDFILKSDSFVFDTGISPRVSKEREDGSVEVELNLPEPIKNVEAVHLLISSGNSKSFYNTERIGEIVLVFHDAPLHPTPLILGNNIREWCIGAAGDLIRKVSSPFSKAVWNGLNQDGTAIVIDSLKLPVYECMRRNALEKILFVHRPLQRHGDTLGVQYFISAITLEVVEYHE